MNVSMQDTYNLGWKLGLVCKRILQRRVLSTYELERKRIAKQLIAFDHKFSRLFSGRPAKDILDETGVSMAEFTRAFRMSHMFTTAIGITYQPSLVVASDPNTADQEEAGPLPVVDDPLEPAEPSAATSTPSLAGGCRPGARIPSHQVVSQADARPWTLHHKMPSDGRFRLVVFGGDVSRPARRDRVNALGRWLRSTLLPAYAALPLSVAADPHGGATMALGTEHPPSVIDVLLVHSAPRESVELLRDLDDAYHPFDARLGWEYGKVFVDAPSYHEGDGRAYEKYGVDRDEGAVVVVRPDGYVGLVTSVGEDGWDEVQKWFDGVLRRVI